MNQIQTKQLDNPILRARTPRYVAFGPTIVELKMSREEYVGLRQSSPKWQGSCDVTPSSAAMSVHFALQLNPWDRQAVSTIRVYKCPDCQDGDSMWVICRTCGGSRRVASA